MGPPRSSTWAGVYLDDLLSAQKVKRKHLLAGKGGQALKSEAPSRQTSATYRDSSLLSEIRAGYEHFGFPRALHKESNVSGVQTLWGGGER